MLSGMGGALCQRSTQLTERDDDSIYRGQPTLFSLELSVYSTLAMLGSTVLRMGISSDDRGGSGSGGDSWTSGTVQLAALVPIITNAVGGLLVVRLAVFVELLL